MAHVSGTALAVAIGLGDGGSGGWDGDSVGSGTWVAEGVGVGCVVGIGSEEGVAEPAQPVSAREADSSTGSRREASGRPWAAHWIKP